MVRTLLGGTGSSGVYGIGIGGIRFCAFGHLGGWRGDECGIICECFWVQVMGLVNQGRIMNMSVETFPYFYYLIFSGLPPLSTIYNDS